MLLLCALLLATPQGIELPESGPARAWAGVGPETVAIDLKQELFADHPWLLESARDEKAWKTWGEWLAAEGRAESSDPERRAGLLSMAIDQARWTDAWAHFERLGAAPPWAAAVLPRLLPGVPASHPVTAGGLPEPLPDGVLLRPAIPPRIPDDPPYSLRPRRSAFSGLRVGESIVDFAISIEPSGVQVDLTLVSGPAVVVQVVLPEPPGQEIRIEYIDWMRQDEPRLPMRVELLPDGETHNLFGRFAQRSALFPAAPSGALPQSLERGGLWFEAPPDAEMRAEFAWVARALAGAFSLPGGLLPASGRAASGSWNGTVVHAGEDPRRTLIQVISLAEQFVRAGGLRRDH